MLTHAVVPQEQTRSEVAPQQEPGNKVFVPRTDIYETENEIVLHANLPGVQPDGLDIHFTNGDLKILGRCEPRQQGMRYLWREYEVGHFHRSFHINEQIDADKIQADMKGGVLTITLPKSEAVKPRRIAVKQA